MPTLQSSNIFDHDSDRELPMTEVSSPSRITVIIPVLNEQDALPYVLRDIPWDIVREVIVVDNGSTDATSEVARRAGARVIYEPRRGYGAACLAGAIGWL